MKKTVLGLVVMVCLILAAGTAMAHRDGNGMMRGYSSDDDCALCSRYDADPEEVRAITDKYSDKFDALHKKLEDKRDLIHKARKNDATTIGELNLLREEMRALRSEKRALADKVNEELSKEFGPADRRSNGMMGGGMHMGKRGCGNQAGMMAGGMHKGMRGGMHSGMMGGDMHEGMHGEMMGGGRHKGMRGAMHTGMMGGAMHHDMSDDELESKEDSEDLFR